MKYLFIDFESYYSDEYSLRKISPVEYILDPRWECIGAAVAEDHAPARWIDGPDVASFFADCDPANTAAVSHNSLFDAAICAWRYGWRPRLLVDTMGMARCLLGHKLRRVSLASCAAELGLGTKGDAIHAVKGMGRAAIIASGLMPGFIEYALNDAEVCRGIFRKLRPAMPTSELLVMDMVIRACTEPQFRADGAALAEHLGQVLADKEALLQQVSADVDTLRSNDKFAALLRSLGVDPPTKMSLKTGKEAYAFARTDPAFMELLEHDEPAVQAVMAARLGHKSSLEETRTKRFISIANLQWPSGEPQMPMPLRYGAAHTHRLGGDWKLNVQNLPSRKSTALRRALIARRGEVLVGADASQIEARICAWVCGQTDLVERFAAGADVYSEFATAAFNRLITKKDNPTERFVGKTAVLGLGYGLGWPKFQRTVKLQSKDQTGQEVILSDEEAAGIVGVYRRKNHHIKAAWGVLNNTAIPVLAHGGAFEFGPCVVRGGEIEMPGGLKLYYHELKRVDEEWQFTYGGVSKKLYGGKLLENLVQTLARIHTMDAAVRIRARTGRGLGLQIHDELIYSVEHRHSDVFAELLVEEMSRPPVWAPDLPLAAEVHFGGSIGELK